MVLYFRTSKISLMAVMVSQFRVVGGHRNVSGRRHWDRGCRWFGVTKYGTNKWYYVRYRAVCGRRDPLPGQEWAHVDSCLQIVGQDACRVGIPPPDSTMTEGRSRHLKFACTRPWVSQRRVSCETWYSGRMNAVAWAELPEEALLELKISALGLALRGRKCSRWWSNSTAILPRRD